MTLLWLSRIRNNVECGQRHGQEVNQIGISITIQTLLISRFRSFSRIPLNLPICKYFTRIEVDA